MNLKIEVLLDEYPFFRETRIGRWRHVFDYSTGEGEWYWEGQRSEATGGDPQRAADAESLRPASPPRFSRRERMPMLSNRS